MKSSSKLEGVLRILLDLRPGEGRSTPSVGVKSYNPRRTTCGEGAYQERI